MEIELYYTPQTRSIRPRWLLEELGIPYTLHPVDLFGGERNPLHPLGSVPAVRIDGQVMIESAAICHWLADRFPARRLAPGHDDAARARYEQWMFFVPATLEPPAFEILLHTRILPEKHRVPEIVDFARRGHRHVLRVLERELTHDGYLLGTEFCCADILLASTLNWLPDSLAPFPALTDYLERVIARPAYRRAQQPVPVDNGGET